MSHDDVVCQACGRPGPDDESALLAWTRSVDRGRALWTCPACSREHLRAMEARLDPAWW